MPKRSDTEEAPSGEFTDDSYTTGRDTKGEPVPVQSDNDRVEDPMDNRTAGSDAQLERDDIEAIDKSNIMSGNRTRHAKPRQAYREPGDEEGLPDETGRSAVGTTDQVLRTERV